MALSVGADYTVIEASSALISASLPYKRTFKPENSPPASVYGSAFLLFWVKTGYSDYSEAASVRIDGKEIGKIFPRPWLIHYILDLEADIIVFDSKLIQVQVLIGPADHVLEIVPSGKSFLILGTVLCEYHVKD